MPFLRSISRTSLRLQGLRSLIRSFSLSFSRMKRICWTTCLSIVPSILYRLKSCSSPSFISVSSKSPQPASSQNSIRTLDNGTVCRLGVRCLLRLCRSRSAHKCLASSRGYRGPLEQCKPASSSDNTYSSRKPRTELALFSATFGHILCRLL